MKNFVHFKNIDFAYENANKVFDGLDLQIAKGQKIGIVGHSGAGKSTLINLLLKNFAITNYKHWDRPATQSPDHSIETETLKDGGDILINNQSIYDVSSDSLRSKISLIPQDIMLFHRSIGENIAYAKENPTQEEIENAAKSANIHEFIMNLPEKYDTLVGERGIKLSGGQRQRIAIARAILKNAPILILDEATSALDSETEQEIQKSINAMLEQNNATVLAIAHRLSTIKHMNRIVVMHDGKVAEDGSFQDLISRQNGIFKQMWDSQVNGMVV
jgi:ATP-binding cassette subfamily B protein